MKSSKKKRKKPKSYLKVKKPKRPGLRMRLETIPRGWWVAAVFAVVLLVGLLGGFFSGFVITPGLSDISLLCSQSDISIYKAIYDYGTGDLTVIIYNRGEVPLRGFEVRVDYPDGDTKTFDLDYLEISENDVEGAPVPVNRVVEYVEVISRQCPETRERRGRNFITGL